MDSMILFVQAMVGVKTGIWMLTTCRHDLDLSLNNFGLHLNIGNKPLDSLHGIYNTPYNEPQQNSSFYSSQLQYLQ